MNKKIALCYEKLSRLATSVRTVESGLGEEIKLFRFGKNPKTLLVGSIHAREWITGVLLTQLAEKEYTCSFDLIPFLNVDGVGLCLDGINSVKNAKQREFLLSVNKTTDFALWKADGYAVDLNVNFDADWGEGLQNETSPSSANYIGKEPFSQTETRFIRDLLRYKYALVVSYHSLGEEIYWGYESNFRHYEYAKKYAEYVGYQLKRSENSTGGLKDYYALNYDGLGLTVEVGDEKYRHPYPEEKLDLLLKKHDGSIKLLTEIGENIYEKLYARSDKGRRESV